MSTATHTVMKTTALCGGPGTPPLIHNLTHSWTAGVHAICGDEGTGKTTLLRLLAGDLPALGGHMNVPAGGVFWVNLQGPEHDQSTVEACWDSLRQRYPYWNEELLQDLAEELDMEKHRHKRLEMLSTGSRRKVMVIAALASGAAVTLLDQPFVSLDRISIRTILDFLVEAAEHPSRAWIVADYEVPSDVPLASVLSL
jgi:ABC-type multidrug transport system ATPase subunit